MAAFTFPDHTFGIRRHLPSLKSDWQSFPGHYLLYASSGTFTLEVHDRQWLLPPQRAAWVTAETRIRINASAPVASCSILFARDSIPAPGYNCRVFAVTPLAREMLLWAMRWDIERDATDQIADRFFAAVADVCLELAETAEQFWLPQVQSAELTHAFRYILDHLDAPLSIAQIAGVIHVSSRTLARRFVEEAHLTCAQFISRARMLRAMDLLAGGDTPITEVAYAVGFESVSAFNHNFRRFTQDTPMHYRKRYQAH